MELIAGSPGLARRLEAADARIARLSAEAQGRLRPAEGAAATTVAGGTVAFAGVGSPLTHAIGVGMNGPVTAVDLDTIEGFYRERGSVINIDLCPAADPTLADLLGRRGYRCVEFNNVLVRRLAQPFDFLDPRIRRATEDEEALWSRTLALGFFEHEPTPTELEIGMYLFHMEGAAAFFGFIDEVPAAGAAMAISDGIATLFADATLGAYRGRGLQTALVNARLAEAGQAGADLATVSTLVASVSQRTYERCGFRVAYTKMNMQLDLP